MSLHFRPPSLFVRVGQTMLVTLGGVLLVKLFATASTMSNAELLIGPLALAMLWAGIGAGRYYDA